MSTLLAALLWLQLASNTGSISGTVVRADSNQRLDNARVELSGGSDLSLIQRTDGEGRFVFQNVPPGTYHILVSKDGYVRQEYARGAAIVIQAGAAHQPFTFELQPAPTIAGRVMNETGNAIPGIMLVALKGTYDERGQRIFVVASATVSDDRGDYRLYWLDPGDYIVSAVFVPAERQTSDEPSQHIAYVPTYYPAASDISNAQRLPLRIGEEVPVNFRLIRAKTVMVRGTVTLPGNQARSLVAVSLAMTGDATSANRYFSKTDERGDFRIEKVAPGDYVISAEAVSGTERVAASLHLVVKDRDESNVGLIMTPGVTVSGGITQEGERGMDFTATRLRLNALDAAMESFASPPMQKNGSLVAAGVERGTYRVQVEGLPKDAYLKQLRSGSTDLTAQPLTVAWESPPVIEVLVGVDGGHIDGNTIDSTGRTFAGAQVVLIPNNEGRRRSELYRTAASNEDGKFELEGIPPGDYQLFAFERIEERAWLNAEAMQKYIDGGLAVRVTPNSKTEIQVRVISDQP